MSEGAQRHIAALLRRVSTLERERDEAREDAGVQRYRAKNANDEMYRYLEEMMRLRKGLGRVGCAE